MKKLTKALNSAVHALQLSAAEIGAIMALKELHVSDEISMTEDEMNTLIASVRFNFEATLFKAMGSRASLINKQGMRH